MWEYIVGGLVFIFIAYIILKPKKETGYDNVSLQSSSFFDKVKDACCIRSR
jgi:hypothetical protein